MKALIAESLAKVVIDAIEREAATDRARPESPRRRRVRKALGRSLISAGRRLAGPSDSATSTP